LLRHKWTVAIILLRLGHYAVGLAEDERLIVSKTGARYVKNRQRQGGQATNRFVRNREKWIQELFDEAGQVARSRFEQYDGRIDWLALGGDRLVLAQFLKRVRLPAGLEDRLLPWQVPVERPGRSAMESAVRDAWASRVYESPA
jgi:peptide subunit release factor 1 (eRF1)